MLNEDGWENFKQAPTNAKTAFVGACLQWVCVFNGVCLQRVSTFDVLAKFSGSLHLMVFACVVLNH